MFGGFFLSFSSFVQVDFSNVEFIGLPVIQSRSSGYDLRTTAQSTTDDLAHKGVILGAISMRYKSYCATIGRTFFVDPSKEQEAVYSFALALQGELLAKLKDGAVAKDVYTRAVAYVKQKKPELEKHFAKNVGFGVSYFLSTVTILLVIPKLNIAVLSFSLDWPGVPRRVIFALGQKHANGKIGYDI